MWVRDQLANQEGGQQKWLQFIATIDAPPRAAVAAAPSTGMPSALPAGAPVGAEAEAAAFAAFASMT